MPSRERTPRKPVAYSSHKSSFRLAIPRLRRITQEKNWKSSLANASDSVGMPEVNEALGQDLSEPEASARERFPRSNFKLGSAELKAQNTRAFTTWSPCPSCFARSPTVPACPSVAKIPGNEAAPHSGHSHKPSSGSSILLARIIHKVSKRRAAITALTRRYARGPRRHSHALC